MSTPMPVPAAARQPLWYKDAVIYQLHVKTFADSNGDGTLDDFREFLDAAHAHPIEMFGRSLFPRIGELPYMLTLGPYAFFWFRLRRL